MFFGRRISSEDDDLYNSLFGRANPEDQPDFLEGIRDELQGLIEAFHHPGDFYHAEYLPLAPNPRLHIDGHGLVDLPLTEDGAKTIIAHSAQAHFGHGDKTVVDPNVRDTWEIDSTGFWFENPAWKNYIEYDIIKSVWKALGVAAPITPPKCELYKLLLYEKGSHFRPHQDTEKSKGMFATVIILLPSAYTGGEVHVSHDSKTHVLDMASHSTTTAALLAWYTDVVHEVKPVTSGYRLALSYNLKHTSPTPIPKAIATEVVVSDIRSVLSRWTDLTPPSGGGARNLMAYLLKHQYSTSNMERGLTTLKGRDVATLSHLKPILDELGFSCFLGVVTCKIHGESMSHYEEGEMRRFRSDYGDYDYGNSNEDEPDEDVSSDSSLTASDDSPLSASSGSETGLKKSNIDLESKEYTIETVTAETTYLVDVNGMELKLGEKPVRIPGQSFIPRNPFAGANPDKEFDSGYYGNDAGSFSQWYNRSVLLMVPSCYLHEVIFKSAGFGYAFSLISSDGHGVSPTDYDRTVANDILDYLGGEGSGKIARLAIQWGDLELWKAAVKVGDYSFIGDCGRRNHVSAYTKWGFEAVRDSFESLAVAHHPLVSRLMLFGELPPPAELPERDVVSTWLKEQSIRAVASLSSTEKDDYGLHIVRLGKEYGVSFLVDRLLLGMLEKASTEFKVALGFVRDLQQNKQQILDAPSGISAEESLIRFDDMILRLLNTLWAHRAPEKSTYYYYGTVVSIRVVALVESFILTDHLSLCQRLNEHIGEDEPTYFDHFKSRYAPLIIRLVPVLQRNGLKITLPAFKSFFGYLLKAYLKHQLPLVPKQAGIDKYAFGCGNTSCEDCERLDGFMKDLRLSDTILSIYPPSSQRVAHVEGYLKSSSGMINFCKKIYLDEDCLYEIKKVEKLVKAQKRERILRECRSFLNTLGPDEDILELVGDKWPDVPIILQPPAGELRRLGAQRSGTSYEFGHGYGSNCDEEGLLNFFTSGNKRKRTRSNDEV